MKKFYCVVLSLLLLLSSVTVFAEVNTKNTNLNYDRYQELRDQGYIEEDVSYEDLVELNNQSKQLEMILENDNNVTNFILASSSQIVAGDILITNSTIFDGIAGHAAIALSPSKILHIEGPGHLVVVDSPAVFIGKYDQGWIKVYRMNDKTIAGKAALWAQNTYQGSSAEYVINKDLTTTNKTYCSKIVFQAYYYGAGSNTVHSSYSSILKSTLMPPYSLVSVLSGGDYSCNLSFNLN